MTVGTADLHKGVFTLWSSSGLDSQFTAFWAEKTIVGRYPVLHDTEAGPNQPYPYAIFEQSEGDVITRMTGHDTNEKHHENDVPIEFRIHARDIPSSSAKAVCAEVVDEILKVFGGHPEVQPQSISLDYGSVLIAQLVSDFGAKEDDDKYTWVLRYNLKTDVPVMAA